jgi:hypothetical protein
VTLTVTGISISSRDFKRSRLTVYHLHRMPLNGEQCDYGELW